jgi:alanyl-tRNA synthetase
MNNLSAKEVRERFLEFFRSRSHQIVPSAPLVIKNDPTLMFVNAGMNPFKDLFLGLSEPSSPRVADAQKCLRVSGKHNDLEEVGKDTYHHTLFEMLGNWSFGDYFKKEAIEWAWAFLVDELEIDPENLYATVYEGDSSDGLKRDDESATLWAQFLPAERIIDGNKKDNFWEMGETGPCGPCSEIHIDMRSQKEKEAVAGNELVNADHPQVIEIWNLVFIEFNRLADGRLEPLPSKHVDTGMGFERLVRVLQGKNSNYDTDIFTPYLSHLERECGLEYGQSEEVDVAMRVVADHLRAVSFSIADGQLPSNSGAGYVIRRILRRAIRYGYTFLGRNEPFIHGLVGILQKEMGEAYPELRKSEDNIRQVILEEEKAFLRTLSKGMLRIETLLSQQKSGDLDGKAAFELYDTYGFPVDLTRLILEERGGRVDEEGFRAAMEKQRERARSAGKMQLEDWVEFEEESETEFIGYDRLSGSARLLRFRKVTVGKRSHVQMVFDRTPFYAEGGGQVGDQGWLTAPDGRVVKVFDCRKETGLHVHMAEECDPTSGDWNLEVDRGRRASTQANHSATHLLHKALRDELGEHVEQKGSLVAPDHLRFDFSHYSKLEKEQIGRIEERVNEEIWKNVALNEFRSIPIDEALKKGAMALFGEKYGEEVRAIQFGDSMELCGGTHVSSTGAIGQFRILAESSVASGIRRIEAVSASGAYQRSCQERDTLERLSEELKQPKDLIRSVGQLKEQVQKAEKKLAAMAQAEAESVFKSWSGSYVMHSDIRALIRKEALSADQVKNLLFRLAEQEKTFAAVAGVVDGKPHLSVLISKDLVESRSWNAAVLIREWAKLMKGGGGGQPFLATAGGKEASTVDSMLKTIEEWIASQD